MTSPTKPCRRSKADSTILCRPPERPHIAEETEGAYALAVITAAIKAADFAAILFTDIPSSHTFVSKIRASLETSGIIARSATRPITRGHREGTLADAQWYSYGANKAHGLRRTNEDKELAVRNALQHRNAGRLRTG